jgi:endogenous inhibitor of DNA gyrase (YacG/DUF329 family)
VTEDELRQSDDELRAALAHYSGDCPQCGYGRPLCRDAVSDYPGYAFYTLMCPRCGLSVQWEKREQAGQPTPQVVLINIAGRQHGLLPS